MRKPSTVRAARKAQIKLNILRATLDLIQDGSFKDLYVEQICERASVSKVTLFAYFRNKEDVLVYFMQLWCLERAVAQLDDPRRGEAGIRRLFQCVGDLSDKPGIMLALIGFIATLSEKPLPVEISAAERRILYPHRQDVEALSVPDLLDLLKTHVDEMIADGELDRSVAPEPLLQILLTIFYGSPLVVHMTGRPDLNALYQAHLDLVFRAARPLGKSTL